MHALLGMAEEMHDRGHVYVVLHGLDAPCLRSSAEQESLSQLAACAAVRMIASVDHVHAGMLFDGKQLQQYNWLWHHMPTWQPLLVATATARAVLHRGEHTAVQQSAAVVLSMLTQASRSVCSHPARFAVLCCRGVCSRRDSGEWGCRCSARLPKRCLQRSWKRTRRLRA